MNAEIIREIEQEQLKSDIPAFQVGDTIRVYAKIKEGARERIQMFEGIVVRRTGGGIRENVTVRRLSSGVGVEKTWRDITSLFCINTQIEESSRGSTR